MNPDLVGSAGFDLTSQQRSVFLWTEVKSPEPLEVINKDNEDFPQIIGLGKSIAKRMHPN